MDLNSLLLSRSVLVKDTEKLQRIKEEIMELYQHARQYGLLSLKEKLNTLEYRLFLLTKGIEIIICGLDLSQLEEILCNYENEDFLEGVIIINGLLCIQSGEKEVLKQNGSEVYNMLFEEYNVETALQVRENETLENRY